MRPRLPPHCGGSARPVRCNYERPPRNAPRGLHLAESVVHLMQEDAVRVPLLAHPAAEKIRQLRIHSARVVRKNPDAMLSTSVYRRLSTLWGTVNSLFVGLADCSKSTIGLDIWHRCRHLARLCDTLGQKLVFCSSQKNKLTCLFQNFSPRWPLGAALGCVLVAHPTLGSNSLCSTLSLAMIPGVHGTWDPRG